jgi:hypothetical protein
MTLAQNSVAIFLSAEGRELMHLAALSIPERSVLMAYVQETNDLGLWIRVDREDGPHLLLVRWEYVVALDFPVGETKTIGLRP